MSANDHQHNRLRQLKGLVAIDPWHEGRPQSATAELYAYVSFDQARLGGEEGDDIAFRLQLKRAEIKFLQSYPKSFDLDPALIWHGDQDTTGTIIRKSERSLRSGQATTLDGKLDAHGPSVGGKLEKTRDFSAKDTEEISSPYSTKTIEVSFQRNDKDRPTWILKPSLHAPQVGSEIVLDGQPWNDKFQRLITMKVDKKSADLEILSSIRLSLTCKREDLLFHDIRMRAKDGKFHLLPESSPKQAIMQEYLRQALIREGLHAGDMNSPFSTITLGEAISEARRIYE